jgi:6-pyruvoyltetrahydropterin/6-carboxytetrahydropterin synthase
MRLMREVRCLPGREKTGTTAPNSWAGSTRGDKLATFWVVRSVVEGPVDERTGYLCDIKQLDAMLEHAVARHLWARTKGAASEAAAIGSALVEAFAIAAGRLPHPASLRVLQLDVSAFMSFAVEDGDPHMVRLTRSFEFSAAHRLHCLDFNDEENLRIFGKCSNPLGHGHNYILEVTVSGTPEEIRGTLVDPPQFDRIVNERVIAPFDHKNLNAECAEFASLNPSVENIARVIWKRLEDAFDRCKLANVRVWETPKTYAEYAGES